MTDANRTHLFSVYAKMIRLKTGNAVFTTTSFKYNLNQAVKKIELNGSDGTYVEVIGNFGVVNNTTNVAFAATVNWMDNIDGSAITIASLPFNITLAPGEYHVYSNKPLVQ
jgi:1,4-alpha-glucan branching enzyme